MKLPYKSNLEIRWSDLDPNVHVRHSVYYDWGAKTRMEMLAAIGISPQELAAHGVGVILMEEQCKFRREIKWGDSIYMLSDWEPSGPKGEPHMFSFSHRILKGADIFCAEITILGAWIDIERRKLCAPPEELQKRIDQIRT